MRAHRRAGSSAEEWPGFTLVELLVVVVVLGILAAVVVFALGGVSASASVASCRADAHIVETAVRAYVAQNGASPTTAELTASTDPYLDSFPASTSFAITLNHGVVEVAAPTGAAPVPASSPRACTGLTGAHSSGTTTTSSTTTTIAPPSPPVVAVALISAGRQPHDQLRLTFNEPVSAWSVSITVDTSHAEIYKGMYPRARNYSPRHSVRPHGPITYTWAFHSARAVDPRLINFYALFRYPGRSTGPHAFATDSFAWSATASGVASSGTGHF